MVTIKKYPNRRLYDTSQSQYINLDYIKHLIIDHKDFEVVDSKSGENLTKTILLQIISESETNEQQSLLTNSLLKQLIRFYGGDMQVFVAGDPNRRNRTPKVHGCCTLESSDRRSCFHRVKTAHPRRQRASRAVSERTLHRQSLPKCP